MIMDIVMDPGLIVDLVNVFVMKDGQENYVIIVILDILEEIVQNVMIV